MDVCSFEMERHRGMKVVYRMPFGLIVCAMCNFKWLGMMCPRIFGFEVRAGSSGLSQDQGARWMRLACCDVSGELAVSPCWQRKEPTLSSSAIS